MIGRIRTAILITIISVAIWMVAEQGSLTEARETVRVSFYVPDADRDKLELVRPEDFTGEVDVELRGAQSAVQAARESLSELQRISPEQAGFSGREDGTYDVDIAEIISALEAVMSSGVEVISTRPARVMIEVIRLQKVAVSIVADVGELDLDGTPQMSPSSIEVTMPARLAADAVQYQIIAAVDPAELMDLPPGEQVQRQATQLVLPLELRGVRGVRPLPTSRVTVSFIVRRTTAQVELPSVVIGIVTPPSTFDAWTLTLEPAVVRARARGPEEAIERIRSNATPVIGVVDVVPADLREGPMQIAIAWFIRDGGRLKALPAGVVIENGPANVALNVAPRTGTQ